MSPPGEIRGGFCFLERHMPLNEPAAWVLCTLIVSATVLVMYFGK